MSFSLIMLQSLLRNPLVFVADWMPTLYGRHNLEYVALRLNRLLLAAILFADEQPIAFRFEVLHPTRRH